MAVLLVLALMAAAMPAVSAVAYEGSCGENLTWSFSAGKLTITGTGDMYDFPERTMAPWYEYRDRIIALELPEGLTRIGDLAFYQCTALQSVTIPDSVTEIGWHAFDGCTGMTMLSLSKGLKTIEEAAFKECTSLKALRLPEGLETIEYQAFYRCESITEVTVPASVTDLGMTVFSFCYQLIRAEIRAGIDVLPDWTFYGCSRLTDLSLPESVTGANDYAFYECTGLQNIEYPGSAENLEQIRQDLNRDLEVDSSLVYIGSSPNEDSTSSSTFEETENGVVADTTTVTQTDNTTISTGTTTTHPADGSDAGQGTVQVDVTLENSDGWEDLGNFLEGNVGQDTTVNMDIYVKDDSGIPQELLDALAGKNVTITVHTASGAQWQIDCSMLNGTAGSDLHFQCVAATEDQCFILGCEYAYQLSFRGTAQINAEVMVQLPVEHARQTATLFQVEGSTITQLQTVLVDAQGVAHFYLASVDSEMPCLIGINVPGVSADTAIVPSSMAGEYGITDSDGVEYVLTGRKSSWNMEIGQVTWILAAVMLLSVAGVGGVMFALNRRKLRMGYVPELDEEE